MRPSSRLLVLAAIAALIFAGSATFVPVGRVEARAADAPAFDQTFFSALKWRDIGPNRGGRSIAVAGSASRPNEYFFGATGGGVWKTADGGTTWRPVADDALRTSSVGALAVSESNPDVVFAGMGEVELRGNVIQGDGVYKSIDGGKTWKHTGLADTQNVARIRIHPSNPDIVYVAALGHTYGPNASAACFAATDGGATWKRVLFRSEKAGAVDLLPRPAQPAAAVRRALGGVPDAALALERRAGRRALQVHGRRRDVDGDLEEPGPAQGAVGEDRRERVRGRLEPASTRSSRPRTVASSRSDDGGATWSKVNDERRFRQRAFYYSRIYADPKDRDRLYVLNTGLYRSNGRGQDLEGHPRPARGQPRPVDCRRTTRSGMINGNDGGANVSVNGGETLDGAAVSDRAALSRDDDGPRALSRVRRAAGQQHRLRAGRRERATTSTMRAAARAATSRRTRGTPTSSTPAATAAC